MTVCIPALGCTVPFIVFVVRKHRPFRLTQFCFFAPRNLLSLGNAVVPLVLRLPAETVIHWPEIRRWQIRSVFPGIAVILCIQQIYLN